MAHECLAWGRLPPTLWHRSVLFFRGCHVGTYYDDLFGGVCSVLRLVVVLLNCLFIDCRHTVTDLVYEAIKKRNYMWYSSTRN